MKGRRMAEGRVLQIMLGDAPVGHLTGLRDGRNLFAFDEQYIARGPGRPTLSLSFNMPHDEEATMRRLREVYSSRMRLPPFFSNLLPEGVLREHIVRQLKIHNDHEFDLLRSLGQGLPGAVRALPDNDASPAMAATRIAGAGDVTADEPIRFSLGGSQLKMSMSERGGRYSVADGAEQWIVKPPHPTYPNVPANEFVMMRLARAAGVDTPEVRLVKLGDLDPGAFYGLAIPQWESWAYAVRRYDRSPGGRIHAEDFAQVFDVYADQEYRATNYDTMGRLIFALFPDRHGQLAEFVRRLTVNILIGNGDAHIKNWSVIYEDGVSPRLAPAYDLVSTIHYVRNDRLALNLAGEKRFANVDESHFERLARRMEAPPGYVLDVVRETVASARDGWPGLVHELGLPEDLRDGLERHWRSLSGLLRIG